MDESDHLFLCRSGEDCVSQDKCPEFLNLKEQVNTGVKGTVQYNGLLTRCLLIAITWT